MKFVVRLALVLVATVLDGSMAESTASTISGASTSTSASYAPLQTWPCKLDNSSRQQFGLRLLSYPQVENQGYDTSPFNLTYLGLNSDSTQPAALPVHNDSVVEWYLENNMMYVVPETAFNASHLHGKELVSYNWDEWYWMGNLQFNVTDLRCDNCEQANWYIYAAGQNSEPYPDPEYPGSYLPYGYLHVPADAGYLTITNALMSPEQPDTPAVLFNYYEATSGFGPGLNPPCSSIYYEIVPNCLIEKKKVRADLRYP